MKKMFSILMIICLVGCSDPKTAIKVLENEGFDKAAIGGHVFFACAQGDIYSTEFVGYKNGRKIHGVVCSGLFKGATIRYF